MQLCGGLGSYFCDGKKRADDHCGAVGGGGPAAQHLFCCSSCALEYSRGILEHVDAAPEGRRNEGVGVWFMAQTLHEHQRQIGAETETGPGVTGGGGEDRVVYARYSSSEEGKLIGDWVSDERQAYERQNI
jgi:hypothetical protein